MAHGVFGIVPIEPMSHKDDAPAGPNHEGEGVLEGEHDACEVHRSSKQHLCTVLAPSSFLLPSSYLLLRSFKDLLYSSFLLLVYIVRPGAPLVASFGSVHSDALCYVRSFLAIPCRELWQLPSNH